MSSNFETILDEFDLFSLIKYEPAVDITQKLEAYEKAKLIEKSNQSKLSFEDILNTILPPRQWKDNHQSFFMQYVSHQKPEREEVQNLRQSLDQSLMKYQARTEGVCPIREKLFSETFDEIIRQVAINCPERGLMLLRVRDERKMTIAAYQTIYQESIAYGKVKQFESQQGMRDLDANLKAIQFKKGELQRKKVILQSKIGSMQYKMRERKAIESEKRQYEMQSLIKQNQFLQLFLANRRGKEVEPQPQKEDEEDAKFN